MKGLGPVRDNVGTCMQATKLKSITPKSADYKDVAGKSVSIPISPVEAQVLRQKHNLSG